MKGSSDMANKDIKDYAKIKDVRLWQIAKKLNLQDSNFSRMLRRELSDEKKTEIKAIIDELSPNIVCPFCGEQVLNKRFCSECGEMLKEVVD